MGWLPMASGSCIPRRPAYGTNPRSESRREFSPGLMNSARAAMRYMMLIYSRENEAATPEEMRAVAAAHKTVMDQARDHGIFCAADPLQASMTATTIRVHNGESLVTDGPFAETK